MHERPSGCVYTASLSLSQCPHTRGPGGLDILRGPLRGPLGPPQWGSPKCTPPEAPRDPPRRRGYVHETYHGRPPFRTSQPTAGRYWGGSAHSPDPTAQSAPARRSKDAPPQHPRTTPTATVPLGPQNSAYDTVFEVHGPPPTK